jgi:hypothetical protein
LSTQTKIPRVISALVLVAATLCHAGTARADEVQNWNETLFRTALIGAASPLNVTRVAAIVQAAVFDAINGIERRFTPIRVAPAAAAGASRDAAVAQAAYATLLQLFPTQKPALDARLAVSLAVIGTRETSGAIASGRAWGQTVADAILLWRSTDGFTPAPPPFLGGNAVGQWRPTPPAFLSGAGPQFAYMAPWVISSPSQFRPAGPPALGSAQYAAEFNETKLMGSLTSPVRTADQTTYAWFWASASSNYLFNQVALSLLDRGRDGDDDDDDHWGHRNSSLDRARLLAQLNLAMADAAIGCWDAKYAYTFWRPVTAIPLADTDGNPATSPDPNWVPLFATPAHPEYPSGHSCISGAAGAILSARFGDRTHFSMQSDLLLGVTRSFKRFSTALEEIKNARIFAGIHFRTATDHGQIIGQSVADYVLDHAVQPLPGKH